MIVIENAKKIMMPLEEKEIVYLKNLAKRAYSAAVQAHTNDTNGTAIHRAMMRYTRIGQGIHNLLRSGSIFESERFEDAELHRLCINYAIGYTATVIAACPIKNKTKQKPTLQDLEKAVEKGNYKKIMETTSFMANHENYGDILQVLELINIEE